MVVEPTTASTPRAAGASSCFGALGQGGARAPRGAGQAGPQPAADQPGPGGVRHQLLAPPLRVAKHVAHVGGMCRSGDHRDRARGGGRGRVVCGAPRRGGGRCPLLPGLHPSFYNSEQQAIDAGRPGTSPTPAASSSTSATSRRSRTPSPTSRGSGWNGRSRASPGRAAGPGPAPAIELTHPRRSRGSPPGSAAPRPGRLGGRGVDDGVPTGMVPVRQVNTAPCRARRSRRLGLRASSSRLTATTRSGRRDRSRWPGRNRATTTTTITTASTRVPIAMPRRWTLVRH